MQEVLNTSEYVTLVRRFVPVFSVFLGTIFVSLLLMLGAMEVLSAARAYVAGESLWSKAQRDAVYSLTLYAQTNDLAYFKRYQQAVAIPLNDHDARIELDKRDYDYAKAYASLLRGGNQPDDIPGLILLYRCCADYSDFARAVTIWNEGDQYIARLERLGDALHAEISSAVPSRKRIAAILDEVRIVDTGVKPLEDMFTGTLGEATRRLKTGLVCAVSAIISILLMFGFFMYSRLLGRIRRTEEDYRLLVNAFAQTADGAMILDSARRIIAVNRAFTTITGFTADEVVGQLFARPQTVRIPGPTLHAVWEDTRSRGRWEGEIWNVRQNGELYPIRLTLSAVYDQRHSSVENYVAVFNDISPHKVHEERLKFLATHDELTGLPNRVEFVSSCREVIERARRHGQRVVLLYIDLDNFKPVNDTYGHAVGDELLKTLATRMKQMIWETDVVARVGGDEFCVLLADLDDVSRGYIVACKLLDILSQPVVSQRSTHKVGASIGISAYPDDGDNLQALLRHADAAMYRVKQSGRGGVAFYSVRAGAQPPSVSPKPSRKLISNH
ncbi:MAG: diguanylate cyclase domain-containing protein [Sulfuricaulis sp.]